MSIMAQRVIVGAEGIVFAAAFLCLAGWLFARLSRKRSVGVSVLLALTTVVYVLGFVWWQAVYRLGLPSPFARGTTFCVGLLIGNLIYAAVAGGKAAPGGAAKQEDS